jgi:lipid-A-disaccharide synthase
MTLDVFISCGEVSGDLVAAELLRPLHEVIASQSWAGVIGNELQALGVKPLRGLDGLQVMGFTAVLKAFNRLKKHMYWIESTILESNPQVVLLVDYPGFHLKLAKRLREKGYKGKIIQYVCPSVWAWKKHRLQILKTYFDEVWGILPFESEHLKETKINYLYTGNPSYRLSERDLITFGHQKKDCLGIFPGSRPQEIHSHLPLILKACEAYEKKYPGQKWQLSLATEESSKLVQTYLNTTSLKITLINPEERFEKMYQMKAAVAVSGTVCLELALHNVPTITIYACGFINYFIAKYLFRIKLKYFTLPNLILKKAIFTELIDAKIDSDTICKAIEKQLEPLNLNRIQEAIGELKTKLATSEQVTHIPLEHLLSWVQKSAKSHQGENI